ncbi:MAG TPA: chemotaxis protein CheB, partial [Firmicutes bacterium]|nr:chemotaxis protein CheB [Bacillota bacterium]
KVVVAIGGSTGGPKVLEEVFRNLPANLPAAVMVSLHMPAGFTNSFADRLNQLSRLEVKEARDGDPILEGVALIAPGGYHLIEKNRSAALSLGPKVHYVRPAVDVMLQSLADSNYRVMAVILTGMGQDGTAGVKILKRRKPGSVIIVQDPQTSIIPSMPDSVIANGCYDEIVPLPVLAGRIVKHARELATDNFSEDVQT